MTPEQENKLLKELLYCTKRSCNNCGKVNCENFQRQRIDCCGLWVSYKDYIKQQEEQIESDKKKITQAHIDGYNRGSAKAKDKIKELEQENNKLLDVINNQDVKIADLEQQIEKLKHEVTAEQKMRQYWHDEYCKVIDSDNFEITKGVSN